MNLTKALRNFYEYIRTGKPDDELTERIHSAVIKGRKNKEWRSAYMKDIARLMDAREEGREEGVLFTRIENIKNIMDSMKISLPEAMNVLKIPEGERDKIKQQIHETI